MGMQTNAVWNPRILLLAWLIEAKAINELLGGGGRLGDVFLEFVVWH